MKAYLVTVLLAAALLAFGTSIFVVHNNHNEPQDIHDENLTALPTPNPPLQNGPIALQGSYEIQNLVQSSTQITADLVYNGPETSYSMDKNVLIRNLKLQILVNGQNELGIKITDANNSRFEVPYSSMYPHDKVSDFPADNAFAIQVVSPFGLVITRKQTNEVVFQTGNFFVYSDLYTQVSINMQNEYIYGLGERRQSFLYSSGSYTFLNKDQYMAMSSGQPDQQTYGTHPMYLRREQSGNFHVVFLRNYNSLQAQYIAGDSLTFITVGGILEFKIFLGDEYPETSLKAYHNYVNGYALHPFWAHGYHQCRWGYDNSTKMVQVWEKFNELDLPIDTIWSDIDYMHELTDFTIDTSRYNATDMNIMLDRSNDEGVHWVPIIDAGIAIGDVSNIRGKEMGVYQKSNKTNEDLVGCVWPGQVNYVDFNHPQSFNFWAEGLMNLTKNYNVTPSGFWIDMNEFSNFVNGEILSTEQCIMPNDPNAPTNEQYIGITVEDFYTNIPFEVGSAQHVLQEKTMSYDAPKYNGADAKIVYQPGEELREFDFHNLNGFAEGIATNEALKLMGNKLPFIISRSQIAGSGQFVQHWTGDNGSQWAFLQTSLAEIFNFNLFGIPMTGADICGFAQNTFPELCARWMQVGLFYPFSRNHNANDTIAQEPYAFPNDTYVLSSSRASMKLRYALLKQYYAYFVFNNGTGTIFRPSFFNFPGDLELLKLDNQFMIDSTLLGIPVLVESANPDLGYTTINPYYPIGGAFYEFNNPASKRYTNADSNKPLNVPFDSTIPLYIVEGSIVFTQFNHLENRARLLGNIFELHVALKKNTNGQYTASGKFITLSDYTDENLINFCQGSSNCNVIASVVSEIQGKNLSLTLSFQPQDDSTYFGEFYVDSFVIYSEDLQTVSSNLAPIKINGPTTIKQSLPLADKLASY